VRNTILWSFVEVMEAMRDSMTPVGSTTYSSSLRSFRQWECWAAHRCGIRPLLALRNIQELWGRIMAYG